MFIHTSDYMGSILGSEPSHPSSILFQSHETDRKNHSYTHTRFII